MNYLYYNPEKNHIVVLVYDAIGGMVHRRYVVQEVDLYTKNPDHITLTKNGYEIIGSF